MAEYIPLLQFFIYCGETYTLPVTKDGNIIR